MLTLSEEEKMMLVKYLRRNSDVFAWSAIDMTGVDPRVIVHRLNVLLEAKHVKQKKKVSTACDRSNKAGGRQVIVC